jgi:hypothetical protein
MIRVFTKKNPKKISSKKNSKKKFKKNFPNKISKKFQKKNSKKKFQKKFQQNLQKKMLCLNSYACNRGYVRLRKFGGSRPAGLGGVGKCMDSILKRLSQIIITRRMLHFAARFHGKIQ